MNKTGFIILIEDDIDDKELFVKLGYINKIVFFADGNEALEFLNKTEEPPFHPQTSICLKSMDLN